MAHGENAAQPNHTHRKERRKAALALLGEWLADDSGYDEVAWPIVKKAIRQSPLSLREATK